MAHLRGPEFQAVHAGFRLSQLSHSLDRPAAKLCHCPPPGTAGAAIGIATVEVHLPAVSKQLVESDCQPALRLPQLLRLPLPEANPLAVVQLLHSIIGTELVREL